MDLNVEQLMARIRESAARRKLQAELAGGRFTLSELLSQSNSDFDLPEIRLSPEFKTRRDNHYHVNELLQFHDREFVRNAYRAILKREPDEPGLNSYLQRLRSGRRNKIDILASLRFSSEGRERKVTVDGLRFPALARSFARIPVIGYVYELVMGVLRLPIATYHHRQFEVHAIAQLQQVADHVNRLTNTVRGLEQFVAEVSSLREQSTTQQHALNDLQQGLSVQETRLLAHDDALADLSRRHDDLEGELAKGNDVRADHSESLKRFEEALRDQRLELSAQQARLASATRSTKEREVSEMSPPGRQDHDLDALLMSVEERFRGERDELKDGFRFYLPYLEHENIKTGIVDVGCGRGEWLELLKEAGFDAQGVDSNRFMVEQCQAAGLGAKHANIFDYFSDVADKSLNAITAFHVIEHLEFSQLVEFIDQSIRTLRPGGLLLLETPNPENVIVATRNFHLDPTHVRPLPGEFIEFLLAARGLTGIEVIGLHPLSSARVAGETELAARFNDLFYGPMDYGIVARRT